MSVADLKAKYNAVVDKNKSLKDKLATANSDIEKLTDAIKARDQAIDSRDHKIQELTQLSTDLEAKLAKANNSIISDITKELFGKNQEQEQQEVQDQSEIVAQLNQERRDLMEKVKTYENSDKANKELIEKYKKAISDLENDQKTLKDKIVDLENKKYDSVTDISSELSDLIKENNSLREQLRLSELNKTDTTKYDLLNEENKLLKKTNNDLTQQTKVLEKKIQDLQDDISKIEQYKEQISQLKGSHDETNDKYVALQRENASLQSKFDTSKKQFEDEISKLNDKLSKAQKDIDNKVKESGLSQASLNDEIQKLSQEILNLKSENTTKSQKIDSLNDELTNTKSETTRLNSLISELKQDLNHSENKGVDLTNQLHKAQGEITEYLKRINNSLNEIDSLTTIKDDLTSQNNSMQKEITNYRLSVQKLENTVSEKNKRIQNLEERAQSRFNESAELQHAYERMKAENERVKSESQESISKLQTKLDEIEKNFEEKRIALDAELVKVQNLTKQRDKMEGLKRMADRKVANLEDEKAKLVQKLSALEKDRTIKGGKSQDSSIFPGYMRKVLLQFFIQDGSTRESLISIILNLVECDDKLIRQAQRSWRDSNQIITHFFKF
ncbi:hypothetical protein TVAG_483530 [Trichomonas vaginalis G3]|uniref:GRIP domain-containing protein n=2 Tax=Trichomonas vaginalis (strain ATCC PRA-98 / G3) TaxID=412133 RepID=A2ETC5_TRIV3|nr:hypothetical protein TVAG_483530 [Trichomonas vaginalis G3]|eukprot:XP_001316338.1 hypothetical protein [Trichomonas vaginalis G3]